MSETHVDVFRFMSIRSPQTVDKRSENIKFVYDDDYYFHLDTTPVTHVDNSRSARPNGRFASDLFSAESPSQIGKAVYAAVFPSVTPDYDDTTSALEISENFIQGLIDQALEILKAPLSGISGFGYSISATPQPGYPTYEESLLLSGMVGISSITRQSSLFMFPKSLSEINSPFGLALSKIYEYLLLKVSVDDLPNKRVDFDTFTSNIHKITNETISTNDLVDLVFNQESGRYTDTFAVTKRILFDILYCLYIIRRKYALSLEPVINALQIIHLLEVLAIDQFIRKVAEVGSLDSDKQILFNSIATGYPELISWRNIDGCNKAKLSKYAFPVITNYDVVFQLLNSTPVIHPIFAQLNRFNQPFNNINPIGIGDLKVVKQKFLGYKLGEIAYVENILDSENKTRVHRQLEKSVDSFSYSSSTITETSKDLQSSNRFDLKQEAEKVIQENINANANASVTYNGGTILANVSGGMSYSHSTSDTQRSAKNFVNEVMTKATERVQSNVSQQRTSTLTFETEETNTHQYNNPAGHGNISGVYRWLDKIYEAQIYNYGKRLMFEFILPEPAAFFIESKLRSYESSLEIPTPPSAPIIKAVQFPNGITGPDSITESNFKSLQLLFDLSDCPQPQIVKEVAFINPSTSTSYFFKDGLLNDQWITSTYECSIEAKGYYLDELIVDGTINYQGRLDHPNDIGGEATTNDDNNNTIVIYIEGNDIVRHTDNYWGHWVWSRQPFNDSSSPPLLSKPLIDKDKTNLTIGIRDGDYYRLTITGKFHISDQSWLDWQLKVFNKIRSALQVEVDKENQETLLKYQSKMTEYLNKLANISSTAINDLIQGQSDAFNKDLITRELKRQCLSMLTKEFDNYELDDLLTDMDAMGSRTVKYTYPHLTIEEAEPANNNPGKVTFERNEIPNGVDYPLPDLEMSKKKGKYIQFLEMAFDWQQLSYIFYPYFWATPKKWIELMSRLDKAAPSFTAFLQAGSAKVVLAVSEGYETAVPHFLMTREPWLGGPSPVIGDPLYKPLYQEIHQQQDDLLNATPEGEPWKFSLPTSLIYLHNDTTSLGDLEYQEIPPSL
ncbi:MAG: hypothetical protein ACO1N8_10955 [Methylophilus sp.]